MARVKLKFGQLHAQSACIYQGVGLVVAQAFSDNKPDGPRKLKKGEYNDLAQAPSFEAALAQINSALTI